MSDFQTLKTVLFTLAPIGIPYLISTYRTYASYSRTHASARRPAPHGINIALNILFLASILFLLKSLYAFSYENVILDTNSRIQTPSSVLWERVANTIRPEKTLTAMDEKLRDRLASTEGRCLYLMYGGDTVGNCPFCSSDEPRSFFYYAAPEIFLPHLFNFVALGLATSNAVAGREGSRFRTLTTVMGVLMALVEVTAWWRYDWKANGRVTRAGDLFLFYGWMKLGRSLGIAVTNMGFAAFLWLTATNRFLVVPLGAEERIDGVLRQLEAARGKMGAVGIIGNVTARNEGLRKKSEEIFAQDDRSWKEVMADEEVKKSIAKAKAQGRFDFERMEREADRYAENLISSASLELNSLKS